MSGLIHKTLDHCAHTTARLQIFPKNPLSCFIGVFNTSPLIGNICIMFKAYILDQLLGIFGLMLGEDAYLVFVHNIGGQEYARIYYGLE